MVSSLEQNKNLIIGLAIGILATLVVGNYSVNNQNYTMMRMMGMGRGVESLQNEDHEECEMMSMMHGGDEMTMNGMVRGLENLEGDEFDQEFVKLMIEHHEGAIEMAKLIDARSQKAELKKMGKDIIKVQSAEIDMMNGWLDAWSR